MQPWGGLEKSTRLNNKGLGLELERMGFPPNPSWPLGILMVLASLDPIFLSQENSKHSGICGSFLLGSGAILAWLGDTGRWESKNLLYGTKQSAQVGQRATSGNKDILLKENILVLNTCVHHNAISHFTGF